MSLLFPRDPNSIPQIVQIYAPYKPSHRYCSIIPNYILSDLAILNGLPVGKKKEIVVKVLKEPILDSDDKELPVSMAIAKMKFTNESVRNEREDGFHIDAREKVVVAKSEEMKTYGDHTPESLQRFSREKSSAPVTLEFQEVIQPKEVIRIPIAGNRLREQRLKMQHQLTFAPPSKPAPKMSAVAPGLDRLFSNMSNDSVGGVPLSHSPKLCSFLVYDAKGNALASATDHSPLPSGDLLDEKDFLNWSIEAQNVLNTSKKIYNFYLDQFNRKSLDDKNLGIDSCINVREWEDPPINGTHTTRRMSNAYWDGKRMAYGEGDGVIFNNFTVSQDIICHELTHGLTRFACQFDIEHYQGETGALNEHISDVFGVIFNQKESNEIDSRTANWLIGEKLVRPEFKEMLMEMGLGHYEALRSMKAPGSAYHLTNNGQTRKDPQVDSMLNYDKDVQGLDNGGVHTNSGILNKAFFLFATNVSGPAWAIPGQLWYRTITSGKVSNQTTFEQFAKLTLDGAKELTSSEQTALKKAWTDVQILK